MRFIRRLRGERGMTMIELMVAATICAVGTIATIGVIDMSREVAVKSEKREAMAHIAEREVESALELPWSNFAHASNPTSPAAYINGTSFAYDRTDPTKTETFVQLSTGSVPHAGSTWDDAQSRISGRVYRFVTRIDANSRRITVLVTADGRNNPPDLLVSSIKTNPIL